MRESRLKTSGIVVLVLLTLCIPGILGLLTFWPAQSPDLHRTRWVLLRVDNMPDLGMHADKGAPRENWSITGGWWFTTNLVTLARLQSALCVTNSTDLGLYSYSPANRIALYMADGSYYVFSFTEPTSVVLNDKDGVGTGFALRMGRGFYDCLTNAIEVDTGWSVRLLP